MTSTGMAAVILSDKPQAVQPGAGEESGIGHTFRKFAQPGFNIAAKLHSFQIGP